MENVNSQNERSLEILDRAINLFQGNFSLIIVNCNYRSLRQKLLTRLAVKSGAQHSDLWWQSQETLYGKLQGLWRDGQIDNISALMCLGFEQTSTENLEDLFVEANLFRDRLKQQIQCPLVLWLNDREFQQLWISAPELAILAAPPIKFGLTHAELDIEVNQQVERLFEITRDPQIPLFWQDTQIDTDRESFSYSELELARRELRLAQYDAHQEISLELEAKLDFALGRLLWRSSEAIASDVYEESHGEVHSISQIYYQCSLSYWQKVDRPIESGLVLFYLGNLWWHNSFVNGRLAHDSWGKAKQFFEEAIAALKQANQWDLIAKYSRAYSGVLEQLKQWKELEAWIESLLLLHQQMPLELAQDYGYLAKIAVERGLWHQVKTYACKALTTLEQVPVFQEESLSQNWLRMRHIQRGQYQLLLTQSYLQLKELELASSVIEATISNFNLNYEPKLYIRFLDTFYDIAFAQGRYLQAFQVRQRQRSLEQQYGLRAFIGAGTLQPKQTSPNDRITELDASKFDINAGEIAASGRTQDVERLVERILSVEHQLTVIHGESGVGKSSLVNAGLIPALLQRSLTGQELLPIKIHVYTNWINAISFAIYKSLSPDNDVFSTDMLSHELRERRKNGERDVNSLLQKLKQVSAQGTQIVLIFDQFEEFFSTCSQPLERQTFIGFWQNCLKIPLLKIVISLREDYLYLLLELESVHPEVDILSRNFRYALGNLSPSDAKSLIENLTEHANFPLEPNLVDELVKDLAGDRGSIRPIELQLVGSQLQDRNITTLSAYLAAGAKQRLVEQSVEEVIQSCGNAAFLAQQVLILLTDDQGKRPLRTYNELRTGLLSYSSNTEDLDLVLEILIGSGLLFQLSEVPSNRYQLVHDYLVSFIRANQEAGLLNELRKVRFSAQRSQANLNRLTKFALIGTVVGLFVMAGLAFQANHQRQLAEVGEIEALISSANSSFLLNRQLESLTTIVQSAKKLKDTDEGIDKTRITQLTFENLQTIVYNIRERYRFQSINRDSPFYAAKFSPDGNILALGSFDGSVSLYQSNGKLIAQLTGLQTRDIRGLSFSPDSKRIASTGKGKSVRIWDVESGKLIGKFYAHQDDILRVDFHPDGRRLLTGSKDGSVKLWDSDLGIELLTLNPKNVGNNSPNKESGAIQDTSFSPDGNLIVTAKNTTIALWDLQGNLLASAIAHDQELYGVKFHPNGKQLLTSGRDQAVKLWQITDQNRQIQLVRIFKGISTDVLSLNFSADGERIALASQDSTIQILNSEGTIEMQLGGHTDNIFDINFSPDGHYLLSASKDRTVRLWDLKTTLINTLYGHTSSIWSVNFSPDGKMFASGSVDKTVRLWNADGTFRQELNGHEDTVYGVSFSADGTKLVTSGDDKTVKIWNSATGKLLHSLNIHGAKLIYATFSPDQKLLATLGWDNKIKIWEWNNTDNPKLLHVLEGHKGTVWSIAFSPDSQSIASTSNDQTVKIWNVNNGQTSHSLIVAGKNVHTMEAHTNGGLAVAYSPDGKQIGSAGKDGKLKLWNAQTGVLEQVIMVAPDIWIYGMAFSPDGKTIATANADKTVKIMDRASGKLLKTLSGHTAEVYALTYSPDSKKIVSASRDNSLKLWDAETLSFDELVRRGCVLLENYLESSPTLLPEQKKMCLTQ
ncbi:WD40 repeat domain-containing protein [Pseudanabaena galeata]|uniref:WD40 repeat domain-containing protein n=1 Tax=Pseudanabaena galeata TaxID=1112103 RepID=UPI002B1FCE5F|nr:WD40 repeat domain-containing protein [Pseudanabaena galeata]